jgi:ABC-type Mn2+/Zn2+ transport system ATPase subunit
MNPSIRVEHITVDYHGTIALQDANMTVSDGSICALVGVNGSGKSTLFKSIMGFLTPSHGRVLIDGMPIQQAQKKGLVAYVPQAEEVDWNFPVSVWDVAMMGRYGYMNILRRPRQNDKTIVENALKRVQMWEYKDRQIGELSGGQRKRAFIARALAQEAHIMLMDEPFTGVDITTQQAIIALLLQLKQEGHTILISTHDLAIIETFCDQVALINRTVVAYGATHEVFTKENVAKVFGGMLTNLVFAQSKSLPKSGEPQ